MKRKRKEGENKTEKGGEGGGGENKHTRNSWACCSAVTLLQS